MVRVVGLILAVLQAGPGGAANPLGAAKAEAGSPARPASRLGSTRREPARFLWCSPKVSGNAKLARGEALTRAVHAFGFTFRDYTGVCESVPEVLNALQIHRLQHGVIASAEARPGGSLFRLDLVGAESPKPIASVQFEVPNGVEVGPAVKKALDELASRVPEGAKNARPTGVPAPSVIARTEAEGGMEVGVGAPGPAAASPAPRSAAVSPALASSPSAAPKPNPVPPSASEEARPARWGPWVVTGLGAAALAVGVGFAVSADKAANDRDASSTPSAYVGANDRWKSRRSVSQVALGIGAGLAVAGLTWRFAF